MSNHIFQQKLTQEMKNLLILGATALVMMSCTQAPVASGAGNGGDQLSTGKMQVLAKIMKVPHENVRTFIIAPYDAQGDTTYLTVLCDVYDTTVFKDPYRGFYSVRATFKALGDTLYHSSISVELTKVDSADNEVEDIFTMFFNIGDGYLISSDTVGRRVDKQNGFGDLVTKEFADRNVEMYLGRDKVAMYDSMQIFAQWYATGNFFDTKHMVFYGLMR